MYMYTDMVNLCVAKWYNVIIFDGFHEKDLPKIELLCQDF